MFNHSHIYTVHENPGKADPADRLALVREGFSFWAFSLHIVWLVANRLWLPAIGILMAMLLLAQLDLPPSMLVMVQLGFQFLLGCHANDLKRWRLQRRGYALRGVVCAESEMMAQRRAMEAAPCV